MPASALSIVYDASFLKASALHPNHDDNPPGTSSSASLLVLAERPVFQNPGKAPRQSSVTFALPDLPVGDRTSSTFDRQSETSEECSDARTERQFFDVPATTSPEPLRRASQDSAEQDVSTAASPSNRAGPTSAYNRRRRRNSAASSASSRSRQARSDSDTGITTPLISRVDFDKNIPKNSPLAKQYEDYIPSDYIKLLEDWDRTLETFLLFVGAVYLRASARTDQKQTTLFSAVLAPFLLASMPLLQSDMQQATLNALLQISSQLPNNETISVSAYPPNDLWLQSNWPVLINILWSISLIISLTTAVFAMLVKQWIANSRAVFPSTSIDAPAGITASIKALQHLYETSRNLEVWHVAPIVTSLPLFIHVAVALFLVGLAPFAWHANLSLGIVITLFDLLSLVLYATFTILPTIHQTCPYGSPLSDVISQVYARRGYYFRRFISAIFVFYGLRSPFEEESNILEDVHNWRQVSLPPIPLLERTIRPEERGMERAVLNLALQGRPIPEQVLHGLLSSPLNMVGRPRTECWLSHLSHPAITDRLAETIRNEEDPVLRHQNLCTLASLSSLLGPTGIQLHEQDRTALLTWACAMGVSNAASTPNLLASAFLLFAKEDSSPPPSSLVESLQKDLPKKVKSGMISALRQGTATNTDLLACCLIFEYCHRYGTQDILPIAELARFLATSKDLPPEFLSVCLRAVMQPVLYRAAVASSQELHTRFAWNEEPHRIALHILRGVQPLSTLERSKHHLLLNFFVYMVANPAAFSQLDGGVLEELEGLLQDLSLWLQPSSPQWTNPVAVLEGANLSLLICLLEAALSKHAQVAQMAAYGSLGDIPPDEVDMDDLTNEHEMVLQEIRENIELLQTLEHFVAGSSVLYSFRKASGTSDPCHEEALLKAMRKAVRM